MPTARKSRLRDGVQVLPNGKAKLRIWIDGKLIKRTLSHPAEAERVRDELRAKAIAVDLQIPQAPASPRFMSIGEAFDVFIREARDVRGRTPKYIAQLEGTKKLFVLALGETFPATLVREDISRFVTWVRKERTTQGRLIVTSLAILKIVLRFSDLPIPKVPQIDVPRRAPKTITADELVKVLEQLEPGSVPRVAVEIALRLGLRPTEVARLRVSDVDLAQGTLLVTHGKGRPGSRGSEELVPIPADLATVLRRYLGALPKLPPDAPLLAVVSRRDHKRKARNPLGSSSLRRALRAASAAAGVIERGGVGWLRHQHATIARRGGASSRVASLALAHEDGAMLAHYDESERRLIERWEARKATASRVAREIPLVGYDSGTKSGKATRVRRRSTP